MNTKEMHGKQIKQVWWPSINGDKGLGVAANENRILQMSATHHGDHDEFWIVEYEKINGEFRETSRINPRFVESFIWA